MKRFSTLMLAGLAGLAMSSAAMAQQYTSTPALALPDSTGPSVQDSIVVTGGPSAINGMALTINIQHTYCADLDIVLVYSGQTLNLSTDNGGAGDNFSDTRFIDSAITAITAGVAPFTGEYRPEGGNPGWTGTIVIPATYLAGLGGFNGQDSNGQWDLIIDDDLGGDFGVLNSWTLDFSPVIPLSGSGTSSGCVTPADGGVATVRVTVSPANNPPSTGIDVEVDGSTFGLSSNIVLFDDGAHGDDGAGDNVFGEFLAIPPGYAAAAYNLPYTVTDDQSGFWGGVLPLNVTDPAIGSEDGTMPATAAVPAGSGPIAQIDGTFAALPQMFKIEICDEANFTATTHLGTTADTQLFLFDANGMGITANDDVPDGNPGDTTLQSRISSNNVLANGTYYLAIAQYNRDPVSGSCGALIFNNDFALEHNANGPGAGAPIVGWVNVMTSTVPFSIFLTGACYIPSGPTCDGDVNCDFALDGFDVEVQEKAVGGDMVDYCQADPDFNGDFALDGFDVEAVELVVGGGPCP